MARTELLDTPFVIIDLDKTERNVARMQRIATEAGVSLRPHAKTHKMPQFAQMQINAGAVGVTVAKLGEAEAMVAGGIRDILIAYPIVGQAKLERLSALAGQSSLVVAVDSEEAARGISDAVFRAGVSVGMLVEVDCGFCRVGVPTGEPALELARIVAGLPGVRFEGVLTFAGQSYDADSEDALRRIGEEEGRIAAETARLLETNGLPAKRVSCGSTPSSPYAARVPGVTEVRPGTYIFGDLMQVGIGAHKLDDCALTVKVTIVSRPGPGRAVVDAGTKVFTSDGGDSRIGTGRGYVLGHPGIRVAWLTEEHGMLELSAEDETLRVGDTLEIVPVHCCAVVNMVDEVAVVRGNEVVAVWPVAGRGKSK
ncbi:alanine racemase [Cohnella soli]|uniref:Alanine racemase n=1 Tax=Cohnella soli TaxID=425005 RepID=A0ABW0HP14_9BACL